MTKTHYGIALIAMATAFAFVQRQMARSARAARAARGEVIFSNTPHPSAE